MFKVKQIGVCDAAQAAEDVGTTVGAAGTTGGTTTGAAGPPGEHELVRQTGQLG
jgi:hypothetical protein